MNEEISQEAKNLAADLDKAPTGEVIIQRILHNQVLLQRDIETLKSEFGKMCEQTLLLVKMGETHQRMIEALTLPAGMVH